MSDWRYILKIVPGRNQAQRLLMIHKVKGWVKAMHRTLELPMVRYNARLPGPTFYLGIAVNDPTIPDGTIPDYVEELFHQMGLPLTQAERNMWPQSGEAIEQFLQGVAEYDHLTTPLTFVAAKETSLPTSLIDTESVDATEDRLAYDHFLWWCSSRGTGSIAQASEIAESLKLNDLEGSVWGVIKKLVLLSHIDVYQDESRNWKWSIAPSTLVETNSNGASFLCGAISGRNRSQFIKKTQGCLDGTNGGPSRSGTSHPLGVEIQRDCGFIGCRLSDASALWARTLPPINEFRNALTLDPAISSEPHAYSYSRLVGSQFQPQSLQELSAGFYKVQRTATQSLPKNVLLTSDGKWLNGDFATLRFLALPYCNQRAQAQFTDSGYFLIPQAMRWPTPYERGLVMATGQLPSIRVAKETGDRFLCYAGLTKTAVNQIAEKLDIKIDNPHQR